jgi:hypothetical protein
VSAVVKLCAAENVAIVPQGGNTGMSGGATPHEDGREIVLSLTRMNRILDIDKVGYCHDGRGRRGAEDDPGDRGRQRPAVSAQPRRRREAARSAATSRPMPAASRCCTTATRATW